MNKKQIVERHPNLLTVVEAAAMLGMAPETVRGLVRNKILDKIRIGRGQKYHISRESLNSYALGGTSQQVDVAQIKQMVRRLEKSKQEHLKRWIENI